MATGVQDLLAAGRHVFVIGFNRCGTNSLTRLFARSGYPAAHWHYGEDGRSGPNLAIRIFRNRAAGRPLLQGIAGRVLYSDMESIKWEGKLEAFRLFRELEAGYPNARFILNLREPEGWIRSRAQHGNGVYMEKTRIFEGMISEDAVRALWRQDWDDHIAEVRAHFSDRPGKLVEFDIEADPVDRLCAFFSDLQLDAAHWARVGASRSRSS